MQVKIFGIFFYILNDSLVKKLFVLSVLRNMRETKRENTRNCNSQQKAAIVINE